MSAQRIAVWIVGAGLVGAWLASAAGVPRAPRSFRPTQRPADAAALEHLAADVQAQAGRLRTRMASAPVPRAAIRNPFTFSSAAPRVHVPRAAAPRPAAAPTPEIVEERVPVLELIGIAEDKGPKGLVRTAMISGPQQELLMVTAGQRLIDLYDVVTVGADAVELKHVTSGAIRRLALR